MLTFHWRMLLSYCFSIVKNSINKNKSAIIQSKLIKIFFQPSKELVCKVFKKWRLSYYFIIVKMSINNNNSECIH